MEQEARENPATEDFSATCKHFSSRGKAVVNTDLFQSSYAQLLVFEFLQAGACTREMNMMLRRIGTLKQMQQQKRKKAACKRHTCPRLRRLP
jgi:hypothetical protein